MVRIALFLLTNLAVMIVLGLILNITGIQSNSVQGILIMAFLFGFTGSFISLLLSKKIAIESVSGKIIRNPSNDIEHWLLNTVKKQSKYVGISMPNVAIYHALDINAFATGARRNDSLIAVSTGLIKNMSKDEAEAVIAHEISHISSGDMVTMTLIQGVINTFVIFISRFIAQIITNFSGKNHEEKEKNNNNSFIYFLIVTTLELIFGILASIITMWFSRYREFRADKGSSEIVGCDKMISALKRLKESYEPKEKSNVMTFCINGKFSTNSLKTLFMTHPSLDKRIEVLQKIKKNEKLRKNSF